MKRNTKSTIAPKVVRGGQAVPLGNNFYYMRGRKHKDGGIDIGDNPKTGLEVEDGEVMHLTNSSAKVFSSVPFLNGESPAEKVLGGENPNKVFNAQEDYKDRKGLNDDGSTKNNKTMKKKKALLGVNKPINNNEDDYWFKPLGTPSVLARQSTPDNPILYTGTSSNPNSPSTGKVTQSNGNTTFRDKLGRVTGAIAGTVGDFVKDNPEDVIGIGGNIISGLVARGMNSKMLDKLRYSDAPTPIRATKLKTRININPQLDKMRETVANYERSLDNNTASSRVALARKQNIRMNALEQTNQLYGQKENAETELINRDRLNQQSVDAANTQAQNQWAAGRSQFNNAVAEKRSENDVSLVNIINSGLQDTLTRRERRKADEQNAAAIAAANPNVSPELLESLGIKVSKKVKDGYAKVYGKKKEKGK